MRLRKMYTLLLLLLVLVACGGQTEVFAPTTAPTAPPTAVPTAPPTAPAPTMPPTLAPTEAAPTAPPTQVAPTEPPTVPAPTTPPAPTAAPTQGVVPVPSAPLDVQAQVGALLPSFAGDLDRAREWNRYTIGATIDPQARTIGGRLQLEYTNRDFVSLDRLYFHLYPNLPDFGGDLTVRNLAVDGAATDVVYERERYLLRVNLARPLDPGLTTTIALDWQARTPLNASRNLYGAFNKEEGMFSLASSYPIVAIVRGGNWDIGDPDGRGDFVNSETALYDVTLAAPAGWTLATTGVTIERQQTGGQQVERIVSGPQRDFMITLSQYERASAEVDGTRINSYYRRGHAAGGKVALQAASNALQVFNRRYGPYPLAELDVVEVNGSPFLGVEYPGLVEIEHNLYVNQNGLEITVAHEVAHQWWYSQVGNDVQTTSWLDEALASYSQIVYQEEIHGPEAAARELDEFRRRYRDVVAGGRDAPVEQPNSRFRGNYVLLVYGKAVLFFQAMRDQIGEAAFDKFLHAHYANHRYDYITSAHLLANAEGACGCDLDPLLNAWITTVAPVEVP